MINQNQTLFPCPMCGLNYREEEIARQCEAWCREHNSCNIEIIKHAVPVDEKQSNTAKRSDE